MTALPDTGSELNTGPELKTGLRLTGILGVIATISLLGIGTYWAATTQISGAVIAVGSVEVLGKPKSEQHLDGGIIDEAARGGWRFCHPRRHSRAPWMTPRCWPTCRSTAPTSRKRLPCGIA